MRIYYSFYLALLIPTDCSAIKYFTFDNVDSSEHSFASLVSAPNESLPESFTLCSSHVQNKLDGRGFFYLSDQNNRPWLTFRWVLKFGKLIFRIYIGNDPPSMLQIDNAEHFLLNSWNHVCVALDNNSGQISVSVNGNFAVVKMSPKDIPVCNSLKNRLHVRISGKSGHLEQFSGSVSNIQIYHGGSDTLGNIFEKACVQQGDYFAWEDMVWKKTGQQIKEREIEQKNLCSSSASFDVAIAEGQPLRDSVKTCQKLGHGSMTFASNKTELTRFLNWFKKAVPQGTCPYIWTPFSDVIKEGHYVNVDTNVKATFLPWAFSIPKNTGSDRTAVAIDVTLGAQPYVSAVEDYLDCFACTLRTNFSARIYGACHSSFVGRWINGYDKVSANTAS